jgi:hypothetical protein
MAHRCQRKEAVQCGGRDAPRADAAGRPGARRPRSYLTTLALQHFTAEAYEIMRQLAAGLTMLVEGLTCADKTDER